MNVQTDIEDRPATDKTKSSSDFTIKASDLVKAAASLKGVIEKQSIPILNNVLVTVAGDTATLTVTNTEIWATQTISATASRDALFTVPADMLFDAAKRMTKDATIALTVNDDHVLFKSGSSKIKLPTLPTDEFPSVSNYEMASTLRMSAVHLRTALIRTQIAIADDMTRAHMNGVFVHTYEGKLVFAAGSRSMMAEYTVDVPVTGFSEITLPKRAVGVLLNAIAHDVDEVKIESSVALARLTTENFSITTKLIDGKFPDYRRIVPMPVEAPVYASRTPLANAVSLAGRFSTAHKTSPVRLAVTTAGMTVSSPDSEAVTELQKPDIAYDGDAVETAFSSELLGEILGVMSGDAELHIRDYESPALVLDSGNPSVRYVLCSYKV